MKITAGLYDNMVLQRNTRNVSEAHFCGNCATDGILEIIVKSKGGMASKISGIKCGSARDGKFKGFIKGLPAGGPYDFELRVARPGCAPVDKLVVRNVLVGDVWILGGQSNMEGLGYLADAARPNQSVRAFYMDDRWDVAHDPIHNLGKAVDPVHSDLAGGNPPVRASHVGVGPGVAFGQEMFRRTGVPQGLIACAHGGTSMRQWAPELKVKGSRSLYGAMLRRFHQNGGKIAGVAWYQGCSDATDQHVHYTPRMVKLVKEMRKDFGNPRLPVVIVQIAAYPGSNFNGAFWNSIQEQQRLLPGKIMNLATVPAIDLSLDDVIHISGADQQRLGKRMAQAMDVLRGRRGAGLPPIELGAISYRPDAIAGKYEIRIRFKNVKGRLRADGKPAGFHVAEPHGVNPVFYRTDLEKNTAVLRIQPPFRLPSLAIHYGYGCNPYCNVTDSAGRSLPVFGPVPIKMK